VPLEDVEKRRAYAAAYYASHRKEKQVWDNAYRVANREKIRAKSREWINAWRAANPEASRAKTRASHARRRDKARAYGIVYYAAHRDELRARSRAYYAKTRDRNLAANRAWRAARPGIESVYQARRRARMAGGGGSHTVAERREKFALLGNVCIYCGEAKPLTVDHNIPIVRGGDDNIANILPACKPCNSRKHSMTAREFLDLRTAALAA